MITVDGVSFVEYVASLKPAAGRPPGTHHQPALLRATVVGQSYTISQLCLLLREAGSNVHSENVRRAAKRLAQKGHFTWMRKDNGPGGGSGSHLVFRRIA